MNKSFFKAEKDLFGNTIKDKNYIDIPEYTKIEINNFEYNFEEIICIDIECSGLKPYKQGHKIICISITDKNKTIVFNKDFDKLNFKNKKIIAHNIKFEMSWIKNIWNIDIKPYWDTMICHHILDNTDKTGLKYLVEKFFNIKDYDINISKYLKAENSNDFNDIENADQNELMKYCGYDSYFTYKLYELQKSKMNNFLMQGFNFFLEATIALQKIESNGFCVNSNETQKLKIELENKLIDINKQIQNSKEVKNNWQGIFNFNSTKDMNELLFNKLKIKPIKITEKGNNSCDKNVLSELNLSFTNKILEYKKYEKLKNTYLNQIENEIYDNKIHPCFNLHTVSSYRSSASNPNIQNFPKRDEETKLIRRLFKPSIDNQLVEIDYKSLEVMIGCCYHNDPIMINYVTDSNSDMHLDTALDLFLISRDHPDIKKLRFIAKSFFVFAQFYGDYYLHCANNIMKEVNVNDFGFTKQKFINHCQDVENDFWNIRFKVYNEWKNKVWNDYQKSGFIRLKSGFICNGNMNKKQVTNIQIQGSSFHCLLWSLIETQKYLEKNNCKSKIITEIHDSMLLDFNSDEKNILKDIEKIMTKDIRDYYKWINIPLQVSFECSEINGNWAEMKELKI